MSSPIEPEQLIECDVCHAVQKVDLRKHPDGSIKCGTCGAPLPLDELRDLLKKQQARPDTSSAVPRHVIVELTGRQRSAAKAATATGVGTCAVGVVVMIVGIIVAMLMLTNRSVSPSLDAGGLISGQKSPTPALVLRGHSDFINAVAYSLDGRFLASGGDDHLVRVWDLTGGDSLFLPVSSPVQDVAFSPDGTMLAAVTRDGVHLWSMPDGTPIEREFGDYYFSPRAIAFSPDSRWLAFSDSDTAVWDVQTAQKVVDIEVNLPDALIFNGDGSQLITRETADPPMIWDTGRGLLVKTLSVEGGFEGGLSLTEDGQKLVYLGSDGIVIYDIPNDSTRSIDPDDLFSANGVVISPDGRYLAVADRSGKILILDEASGDTTYELETDGLTYDLAFSPDSSSVSVGARNGAVYIWVLFEERQQVSLQLTPQREVCMITANADVRLAYTPGEDRVARVMSKDYQAEVDGQRSVNDVVWWHLRDGTWARSDFVTTNEYCEGLERK